MSEHVIDVAKDFTRFPAGRYRTDGRFSGERFREDFLIPALLEHGRIAVELDGTMGFGSSFLEEAFGGLARDPRFRSPALLEALDLRSRDRSLVDEIRDYIAASAD